MNLSSRSLAAVAATLAFASSLAACGTVYSHTAVTHVQQAALIAAPSAGLASSPLVPLHRLAVEGGLEDSFGPFRADPAGTTHPAHLVPLLGARARLFYRLSRYIELGTGGSLYLPGATAATAQGLDESTFHHQLTGRFDLQGRLIFNPDSAVRVGWSVGLGFASVPFIQAGTTVDTIGTSGHSFFWEGDHSSSSSSTSLWTRDSTFLDVQVASSIFLAGDPHPRLGLIGGLLLQNQRVFAGQQTLVQVCVVTGSPCDVPRPEGLRPGQSVPALMAFLGAEARFGRFSLLGRAQVVFPTDPLLSQSGTFGGALDARYTFGR